MFWPGSRPDFSVPNSGVQLLQEPRHDINDNEWVMKVMDNIGYTIEMTAWDILRKTMV